MPSEHRRIFFIVIRARGLKECGQVGYSLSNEKSLHDCYCCLQYVIFSYKEAQYLALKSKVNMYIWYFHYKNVLIAY